MGSESIAHEAEGRMGYWLRAYEGERNNKLLMMMMMMINIISVSGLLAGHVRPTNRGH